MRILNSEYFFLDLIEFNWIQLHSVGFNWIEKLHPIHLHFLFKILNWTIMFMCTEKANIIFKLKDIETCSMQFLNE